MKRFLNYGLAICAVLLLSACESTYYNAMEKVGVHKRDILVDRIEAARESQQDGQEQFRDALEQFKSVVAVDGGELESQYNKLNATYEDSVEAAEDIRERIDKVESVAEALFDEWDREIDEYSNANLKRSSQTKLRETQRNYASLMKSMHRAEKSLDPVLTVLKDNVLYLKHNLNASAIGALRGELRTVDNNVRNLVAAMEKSIAESNRFIEQLNR